MSTALIKFDDDQVDLIKRTIAKDATNDELKLFMYHCSTVGLDPLAKQIFFQKYNSKNGPPTIAFITSIDGYRSTAERTGKYAGSDDAILDNEEKPNKATVTVYKMVEGIRCAFTASARWIEYYPGDGNRGSFWRKMPCTMLAKVAEALALRKAFPKQLGGMYIREEMEQAGEVVDVQADNVRAIQPPPQAQPRTYTGSPAQVEWLMKKLGETELNVTNYGDLVHTSMLNKPVTELPEMVKRALQIQMDDERKAE